ncbi:hypothetical protein KM472_gp073 [Cynomolgus macaque cytomegalovirus strain Ottawa]|uniref:Uncharacterized protein n=1 Tax=macacine betaherpesvirus 8 TaxID=2560567 RepID=G8H176_9BETA|nr:hypothetical protein KM472_gp073 [Cynomolgus macaque cytomegalovirus strain Ottawa]AEQ32150.1 hypothetical protein cy70 [Cynomolgus macaque cytomegalovirus strain Ottawa]
MLNPSVINDRNFQVLLHHSWEITFIAGGADGQQGLFVEDAIPGGPDRWRYIPQESSLLIGGNGQQLSVTHPVLLHLSSESLPLRHRERQVRLAIQFKYELALLVNGAVKPLTRRQSRFT